jgi:hypothetical protein
MIRITKMSGKIYGKRISSIEDDAENIEIFANEGTPVIIVNSLDDLEVFDIDPSDVTMC